MPSASTPTKMRHLDDRRPGRTRAGRRPPPTGRGTRSRPRTARTGRRTRSSGSAPAPSRRRPGRARTRTSPACRAARPAGPGAAAGWPRTRRRRTPRRRAAAARASRTNPDNRSRRTAYPPQPTGRSTRVCDMPACRVRSRQPRRRPPTTTPSTSTSCTRPGTATWWRCCTRSSDDLGEAQDLAQEAFCRAWQRWSAGPGVRRAGGLGAPGGDEPGHLALAAAAGGPDASAPRAAAATCRSSGRTTSRWSPRSGTLPPDQRRAVVLHYLVDLPVADVAARDAGRRRHGQVLAAPRPRRARRAAERPPTPTLDAEGVDRA